MYRISISYDLYIVTIISFPLQQYLVVYLFVCLFHLHPPVTRKQQWHYILDESAQSCPFPSFLVVSSTSHHLICCLFEATKQR